MDKKYVGNFEFYFETGYEQLACIFHDDRGLHGTDSFYHSLEWSIFFSKRYSYHAVIFNKDGSILYQGPLTRDLQKMKENVYSLSFIPKEMSTSEWIQIFKMELRGEITTNEDISERF